MDPPTPQTSTDPATEPEPRPRTESQPDSDADAALPTARQLTGEPEPAPDVKPVAKPDSKPAATGPSMPARREAGEALLELFVAEHQVRCPSCRAPVIELAGRRCPNCRQQLMLRVTLERPNLASYLFGFTAVLIAAALNVFLAFHFVIEVLRLGMTDDRPAYLFVAVASAVATIVVLVIWIVVGRRFRRRRAFVRWIAAALTLVLPTGALIALVRVLT